jgi:kynurenine formamidase
MTETSQPDPDNWPGHTGNWNRWPNDLGTLNLVTPETTLRGVQTIESGRVISCSRPVTDREPIRNSVCFEHEMLNAGAWDLEPERMESLNSADKVSMRTHGMVNTHLDALAHVGHNGKGFNGVDFDAMVTKEDGVKRGAIDVARGIVTRGVLIDIPRMRGVSHLEPGEYAQPDEIASVADALLPGDAAVIRTGATLAPGIPPKETGNRHGIWQGIHPECVEILAKRDIGLLATDSSGDAFPSPYGHIVRSPVHTLCLTYYGIHLLHNMDLEELSRVCAEDKRSTFLFAVTSLHMEKATGSLTSPVAIL